MTGEAAVDLLWLPLGAGGRSVRLNGRVYERLVAARARRPPLALYHAALEVAVDGCAYAVESAPVPRGDPAARGVVGSGDVGVRGAGRLRVFRYEVRCARDGVIPDRAWAAGPPRLLTADAAVARAVLACAAAVPTPTWGRDELGGGEMWNSNAVVAWTLERAGLDAAAVQPPPGGRAPGWMAGVAVARREPAR